MKRVSTTVTREDADAISLAMSAICVMRVKKYNQKQLYSMFEDFDPKVCRNISDTFGAMVQSIDFEE